jgi:two-component system, chemotaxis family, CheB/CheR fusion protein
VKTQKQKSTVPIKELTPGLKTRQFPIVGIGASAGGLEAIEQFLGCLPENSGMAYVVIQHLDPTQKGMLPELLQRITKMKVVEVKDRMVIKINCVYVIPPNKSMSVLKGVLQLFEPMETRGLRLPIDFFLRSLADDRHEGAIGLILSGMGSDGSLGIRAIKEKNGIVMVQEPATAKFDSMPRNAIDSVQVDIIAPANELPGKLVEFRKQFQFRKPGQDSGVNDKSALDKIIILLRTFTGNDFSLYKKNTVYRRIERRMGVHKIDKISSYVNFLQSNPKEVNILFKELLIGVTNFFRDTLVWDKLKETVIPGIIANSENNSVLRAWIPACSTGEEAYSLAIVFKEALEKINPHGGFSLQIFATDLDSEAIEIARKGKFPANIAADISPSRLNRFFVKTEDGYRVNAEIREMIVFAQHNIIMHPPFTRIDILSCRNLLIYVDTELQQKLLGLFYYSLNPEGIMLLGTAETLGTLSHLFTAVESRLKIYKRSNTILVPESFDFPASFARSRPGTSDKHVPARSAENIQILADQLLLHDYSPAGVLVNENGDIIYISGRTGKYLEPAVGKANLNIFAMLRDGLRNEFPSAFHKVLQQKETLVLPELKVGTNGGTQLVRITFHWITKPDPLKGMVMIIFRDVPASNVVQSVVEKKGNTSDSPGHSELEMELQQSREEMQSTREEMQTSQEELKSTNEELQSTNEELQSTNEELTTSKEEMQSLNEELQTVNAELQSKVDDYSRVNNDMKNLLNSTDIATLFLDKELNIRRFTNQATRIFKLIKSDIGRPFTDLVTDLIYPGLPEDARDVLRTLTFIQKQIPARDGRWFSIRIMPYRTFDDRIDGLVITFINISDHKQLEMELSETKQMHDLLFRSSSYVIIKLAANLTILEFNNEAEIFFGIKHTEAKGKNFLQLFIPAKALEKTEKVLNRCLKNRPAAHIKLQIIASEGKFLWTEWSVNLLTDELNNPTGLIIFTKNVMKP